MKALVAKKFGEHPEMTIEERQIPSGRPGHSLIRMHAATVNPLSNQIRHGSMPTSSAPLVLSNDGSGTVEQSDTFAIGTKVAIYGAGELGIKQDGLQQQYVLVEDRRVFGLPANADLDIAAAIPINYVTAYQALSRVGRIERGQTVLVGGASGSVGHALMQLASAMGARPIAIVSTAAKAEKVEQNGAESIIDLSAGGFQKAVLERTDGKGADIAFDPVGGDLVGQLIRAVRPRGTVVSIGFAGGKTGSVDIVDLVVHEKRLLGYDAWLETDPDVAAAFAAILNFWSEGLIQPSIDSTFPLQDFASAYERLASRAAVGTILLNL